MLSHETSQIGLKIVISRVVNKTRTRGRGRGRGLFFFLFKECCFLAIYRLRSMAVLSDALLSGEAAKACRKRARSVRERAAKPQFRHSFTALSHLFFARPTKTAILRRLRDLHQQCIFYKNKLQWSTLHVVKSKQI